MTGTVDEMMDGAARKPPLSAIFLATYFPKPTNPLMGVWALDQARALVRQHVDLRTISFTSWLPTFLSGAGGRIGRWAGCPQDFDWQDLHVEYPRWLLYELGQLKHWDTRYPQPQHWVAWQSARRRLLREVKEHRPDVVYAHHTRSNGHLAYQVYKRFQVPYVITDHDFDELRSCERFPARKRFFRPIIENAATMVAVSSRMESDIRELFPRARVRTVHNGSDPIPARLSDAPRPVELAGRDVVFSAANFYPRKGIPTLIRAFAEISGRHPRAILRIVGDGQDRPAAEKEIRQLHMEHRIRLLGSQPHERVLQEMVWCDVFALVGWDEPAGVVYYEAMAAGKPIVWTSDGGVNDVVKDGVHGYAAPPRDPHGAARALDLLLADAELARKLGGNAKQLFADRLSWDANASTMATIFREAAGSPE